jgi:hypothetical protein
MVFLLLILSGTVFSKSLMNAKEVVLPIMYIPKSVLTIKGPGTTLTDVLLLTRFEQKSKGDPHFAKDLL